MNCLFPLSVCIIRRFFFFLTEHNLYKFAHNEVSSIYTLICSLNPRLTLLTEDRIDRSSKSSMVLFRCRLATEELTESGTIFWIQRIQFKDIYWNIRGKADSLKLRQNGQQKTCNLFCNIAAKRFEQRCYSFYHPRMNTMHPERLQDRFERGQQNVQYRY